MKAIATKSLGAAGALAVALAKSVASPAAIRSAAVFGGGYMVSHGAALIYAPAGWIVGGGLMLIAGLSGHLRGGDQ
ncbi:hypothetical protein [Massilia sp. TS11]|uniref:hypothetical protein n=1 Tax=Massilia sp. TS11 TaxID=2908003 RepID=UPI001EDAFD72|nr:hypothetical protein [Massilia sp. TS11]MCG2586503.1 hypothetical protein [Massilia sp. TS11]